MFLNLSILLNNLFLFFTRNATCSKFIMGIKKHHKAVSICVSNKWFDDNKDYPYPDWPTTEMIAKMAGIIIL